MTMHNVRMRDGVTALVQFIGNFERFVQREFIGEREKAA